MFITVRVCVPISQILEFLGQGHMLLHIKILKIPVGRRSVTLLRSISGCVGRGSSRAVISSDGLLNSGQIPSNDEASEERACYQSAVPSNGF